MDFLDYFPMPSFRRYQKEAIDAILKAMSSKRYVIVEGPTGSGKSALAITIGRMYGTFLCTPQKMLQGQYVKDFGEYLVELKGKGNYPCLRVNFAYWLSDSGNGSNDLKKLLYKYTKKQKGVPRDPDIGIDYIDIDMYNSLDPEHPWRKYTCDNAPCRSRPYLLAECKYHGTCEYIKQRDNALITSNFSLLNCSNLLLFSLFMPHIYNKRDLLIIDECHTLESFLYDYATITVSLSKISPLQRFASKNFFKIVNEFTSVEEFAAYIKDCILPAYDNYMAANKITGVIDIDYDSNHLLEFNDVQEDEISILSKLVLALRNWLKSEPTDDSNVLVPIEENKHCVGYKIKPFSVATLAQALAFKSSTTSVLLMSATVLDPEILCASLGIDPNDAFFLRIPSTFPSENNPIFSITSIGSMSYKNKSSTLPKMMLKLNELLDCHDNSKGLIHTGSYENMYYFENWLKANRPDLLSRMLFQSQKTFAEKERLLREHSERDAPTVLCGPGFIEGLDLKDNLGRFNILMKVPYISLADPLIKRKAFEFPEWYDFQTALSLIQAFGRCQRSADDWATTYVLDSMWKFFYNKNTYLFPDHIKAAIKWM